MGLPGRPSLARMLLLSAVLSALPLGPPAAGAATPGPVPVEQARPATRPDSFVPGRVLAGKGRTRVVELDQGADVRAAARRLADRPGVAFAEPDWVRRVEACDPAVCWHLQPRPGANVLAAHDDDHRGTGRTVAVVDTGVREPIPTTPIPAASTRPTTSTSGTGSPSAGAAATAAASRPWQRRPSPTAPRWPA